MTAGVPSIKCLIHFVGLADKVDGLLNLPKVLGGDIVSSATKFPLEADARWVEALWQTALWVTVVMVVTEVASPVIEPATDRVDKARWVKFVDYVSKAELWVVLIGLTPAFVVDDLENTNLLATKKKSPI
jgi:hypothetical protein